MTKTRWTKVFINFNLITAKPIPGVPSDSKLRKVIPHTIVLAEHMKFPQRAPPEPVPDVPK